jgi:hypothetical protein
MSYKRPLVSSISKWNPGRAPHECKSIYAKELRQERVYNYESV